MSAVPHNEKQKKEDALDKALVACRDVLRQIDSKQFSDLTIDQKKYLNRVSKRFLVHKLGSGKAAKCQIHINDGTTSKPIIAVPNYLVQEFSAFIGVQISTKEFKELSQLSINDSENDAEESSDDDDDDEGDSSQYSDAQSKKPRRRIKLPTLPLTDRRDYVPFTKGRSDADKISPVNPQVNVNDNNSSTANSNQHLKAWTDVIRTKYPTFIRSTPSMSVAAKTFLQDNNLELIKVHPDGGSSKTLTYGIPLKHQTCFLKLMETKYDVSEFDQSTEKKIGAFSTPTPKGQYKVDADTFATETFVSIPSNFEFSMPDRDKIYQSDTKEGLELLKWDDAVRPIVENYIDTQCRNIPLSGRIRNGVKTFILTECPKVDVDPGDCWFTTGKYSKRKSYGVPLQLRRRLAEWFVENVRSGFREYNTNFNDVALYQNHMSTVVSPEGGDDDDGPDEENEQEGKVVIEASDAMDVGGSVNGVDILKSKDDEMEDVFAELNCQQNDPAVTGKTPLSQRFLEPAAVEDIYTQSSRLNCLSQTSSAVSKVSSLSASAAETTGSQQEADSFSPRHPLTELSSSTSSRQLEEGLDTFGVTNPTVALEKSVMSSTKINPYSLLEITPKQKHKDSALSDEARSCLSPSRTPPPSDLPRLSMSTKRRAMESPHEYPSSQAKRLKPDSPADMITINSGGVGNSLLPRALVPSRSPTPLPSAPVFAEPQEMNVDEMNRNATNSVGTTQLGAKSNAPATTEIKLGKYRDGLLVIEKNQVIRPHDKMLLYKYNM
jgi:hypothetical protein